MTSLHRKFARDRGDALGHPELAVVHDARLRDCFRTLFAQELASPHPAWPRTVEAAGQSAWLRRGDILVELSRTPTTEAASLLVSMSADSGTRLLDALLGARVPSSLASASGQPSEAECGVLAYAAARLLATQPDLAGWIVRDVRAWAGETLPLEIVWPLSLDSSMGRLELALWLSPSLLQGTEARHPLAIVVPERVEPGALAGLAPGDVWISDSSTLTNTSEGLAGAVTVALLGTDIRLVGSLLRDRLRVSRPAPAVEATHALDLVLTEYAVSLLELARLAGGGSLACPLSAGGASLRQHGRTLAWGELITWRGAVGLRVEAVDDSAQ